jgi:hypothetical protein
VGIPVPDSLLLHSKDHAALEQRSRLLLALYFLELGELSSGQAAEMCGLSRVGFLFERSGDRGTRKLNPPSNKNLEIAEDVAGVAGQQNAAPPWGFGL